MRLWEHTPSDPNFLHVRYGLSSQPLSLELVPPEQRADRPGRPGRRLRAAPAAGRAPGAAEPARLDRPARLRPDRGHRRGGRRPVPGPRDGLLGRGVPLPRAPRVAVLCSDDHLAHWDWLKWLPHAQSGQQGDAVGPRRMVTTSLDDLAAMLPPDLSDRPRFGADERAADPAHPAGHRRRPAAAGQPPHPARRPARRHAARPARALGRARRPDPAAAGVRRRRRPRTASSRSPRCGSAPSRSAASRTSATWPPPRRSPAGSRRCTP